jgi:hypothetical protein
MANEEQLGILRQGIRVWNAWRQAHRQEAIDLSEAELSNFSFNRTKILIFIAYSTYGSLIFRAVVNNEHRASYKHPEGSRAGPEYAAARGRAA